MIEDPELAELFSSVELEEDVVDLDYMAEHIDRAFLRGNAMALNELLGEFAIGLDYCWTTNTISCHLRMRKWTFLAVFSSGKVAFKHIPPYVDMGTKNRGVYFFVLFNQESLTDCIPDWEEYNWARIIKEKLKESNPDPVINQEETKNTGTEELAPFPSLGEQP